jgi:oxaloacetate decarboxylase beta subunit
MLLDILRDFTSFFQLTAFGLVTWRMVVMWGVCVLLFYLAVRKGFEPLLLIPIAFGAFLANLPTEGLITTVQNAAGQIDTGVLSVTFAPAAHGYRIEHITGGLYDFITQGIKLEIFPPLIFLGVGALTDFGPLIANPRTLLLGAAAQLGVLITFIGANFLGFTSAQAASIGIIGGADGPTAIFVATKLAPELLGAIAVAAYTYMALVPLIQPPIMRALTTKKERLIRMKSLRPVSRAEKLTFALLVTVITILLVPAVAPLIGMLMLGNFLRECGVTERLLKASQNEIINVVTIFLGTSVGITMSGETFLRSQTMMIIGLGVIAFGFGTAGGVLAAKIINLFDRHNPINPLIGSAGVSAVPMAARVSHVEGQRADQTNYLLMHAMGPNVAGVIGTAVIAGYYIATLSR